MDLSNLSVEDLGHLQKRDYDSMSPQGLLELQKQRAQDQQTQAKVANPPQIPDAADKAAQGRKPDAKPISLVGNPHFPTSYNGGGMPAQAAEDNPEANKGFAKAGIGLATGGAGGALADGAGWVANAAVNAAGGGLQKYLSNVIDQKPDPTEGVAGSAALGGGLSAAASGISSGASKLADYLMQKAVGMRRYAPGIGNSLVDQGLAGTKNMLTNQVEDKLPQSEQTVQDVVAGLKGNSDSQPIADAINAQGGKFNLPSTGDTAPGMGDYAKKVRDYADEFSSNGEGGELSPQDLLAVKRQGDWVGYTNSGNPASSLESDLGRAQANKARDMLNTMSDGKTADALGDEQALILAKKGLNKPETIHQGGISSLIFGKVPGQSLFGSVGAQGLQKGVAGSADILKDPRVLQSLFGAANSTPAGGQ